MTKISLTPIIDVVFILLIFFMLATNFQSFNKTEIKISNETASVSQSDKKIFLVEFNKDSEFKLNGTITSLDSIKSDIISSKNNGDDFVVITKPSKDTDVQLMLSVLANLKSSNIENVTLGVSKNNTNEDTHDNKKKSVKMPLLKKQ
jgi:biopolymer transport protein ExbD